MQDNKITPILLMENKTIASGETEYGPIIEMYSLNPNGNFSIQLELDEDGTDGTLAVWHECTNISATQAAKSGIETDEERFIRPEHSTIHDAFAADSGFGEDGRDIRDFDVETCYQARIGVKANGGAVKIKRLIVAVQ